MNKPDFLHAVRSEWERWQAALDAVGGERMEQPAIGEWAIKDVIAHVTWHEREMLQVIRERVFAGSELWELPTGRRNEAIYRQNCGRSLADVWADAATVHAHFIDALEQLPEEHYGNPARFRDMPADWIPWQIFAQNSYEHYRDHTNDVRVWLASRGDER